VPIARQTEVGVVSAQNAAQPLVLQPYRRMHPPPRLNTQFFKLSRKPYAVGAALDHEPSVPTPRTVVRKAQEPERVAAVRAAFSAQLTWALAELNQACLLLVERELELRQTLLEVDQHPARVGLVLKAQHEVITVTHDNNSSPCVPFPPLMDPEVERVVHKDVGEKRAYS